MLTKRILFVCEDFLPANSGGKISTKKNIEQLCKLFGSIDCIIASDNFDNVLYDQFFSDINPDSNIINIKRTRINKLKWLIQKFPRHAYSLKELEKVEITNKYELVIIHRDTVGMILNRKDISNNFVLRVENDEVKYYAMTQNNSNSIKAKIIFYLDLFKTYLTQRYLFKKSNKLLFISQKEYQKFKTKYGEKCIFIPPSYSIDNFQSLTGITKKPNNVIFNGTLSVNLNKQGLRWYLDNIHEDISLLIKEYRFMIVGLVYDLSDIEWLKTYLTKFPNIEVFTNVSSVKEYFDRSAVSINPMQEGAGLKIKNLESIINGVPVVSTSVGAEGSMLNSGDGTIIIDQIDGFRQAVVNLLVDRVFAFNVINKGQKKINTKYGELWSQLQKKLFANEWT